MRGLASRYPNRKFIHSIEEKLEQENGLPPFPGEYVENTFVLVCEFSIANSFLTTLNDRSSSVY